MPERQMPTHEVVSATETVVSIKVPRNHIPPGHNRVRLLINGESVLMNVGDWQQFVACVNASHEAVRRA